MQRSINSEYAHNIHLTKTTAAQKEVALSYRPVRGLYFLAVVLVRSKDGMVVSFKIDIINLY